MVDGDQFTARDSIPHSFRKSPLKGDTPRDFVTSGEALRAVWRRSRSRTPLFVAKPLATRSHLRVVDGRRAVRATVRHSTVPWGCPSRDPLFSVPGLLTNLNAF